MTLELKRTLSASCYFFYPHSSRRSCTIGTLQYTFNVVKIEYDYRKLLFLKQKIGDFPSRNFESTFNIAIFSMNLKSIFSLTLTTILFTHISIDYLKVGTHNR